jgi:hypothetical protein
MDSILEEVDNNNPPFAKKKKDCPDDLIFLHMKPAEPEHRDELDRYLDSKIVSRNDTSLQDGPIAWWEVRN